MNLAGQPAKSCTERHKATADKAWLKTRTELSSSAHPLLVLARAMLVGSADRRVFATPKPCP
jgi:hypothetical protein